MTFHFFNSLILSPESIEVVGEQKLEVPLKLKSKLKNLISKTNATESIRKNSHKLALWRGI